VDDDGFQVTLGKFELLFLAAIFCLCGVLLFLLPRYLKLMKINKNPYVAKKRIMPTFNVRHVAQEKDRFQSYSDPNENEGNARINHTQVSVKEVETRFALDMVPSDRSGIFNTAGNIEIGPQDSAL